MSILLSLLAVVAPATGPALSSHDPQTVVAYLQAEGYRAKLNANSEGKEQTVGPWIQTSEGGTNITISFLNCKNKKQCEDISFSSAWNFEDGKGPAAAPLHQWNADKRFTKAYLDREGDPVLEMDVLFSEGQLDRQTFATALDIFTDAIGKFEDVIGWDTPAPTTAGRTTASR
jgi:hypothetical protein